MSLTLSLTSLDGFNGFRLRGIDAGDLSGWYVNHAGDVNGDGLDDVIIGARKGNGDGLFDAGEAYVVYGNAAGFAADFDLAALDGTNGFQINGAEKKDQAGRAVSAAGDVNGDGVDDLIVGAWQNNADGYTDAGASYVVFGKVGGLGAAVDLATLDGTDGFRIDGGGTRFYTGYSVSAAGDVNHDGFDDVIIGAWAADVGGVNKAGQAYVVFGSDQGFAPDMNLTDLDGTNGFSLDGWADDESVGYSVSEAGDINGDGIDDLVISSLKGTAGGKEEAGQTFVVFGSDQGFATNLAMNALDGTNGFVLNGANAYDRAGYSVAHAGDVNGDGLDDIIIGSRWVDMAQGDDVGQAYVVYGSTAGFAAEMDLGALDGTNGFTLNGVAAGDWTGGSVAGAGDVNGDGIDDIVIGAWLADAGGVVDAGSTFVVYGKAGGLAAEVDLGTLARDAGFRVDGYEADAHSGRFVDGAGDLNGDGYDDIIIGAFQDDSDTGAADAGETYVIYGFDDAKGPAVDPSLVPDPVWASLSFAGNAGVRTAVYSEDGTELETVALRYYFNDFAVGGSGIFVSGSDPAGGDTLSMLADALGVRGADDGSLARRLVDGAETLRFDLAQSDTLADATSFAASFVMLGGAGQVAVNFYDDGALVESAALDVVGGGVSYTLAGGADFDAVEIGTLGGLSFAIDDVSFLRQSSAAPTPIGDLGRVVSLDFTEAAGGKTHVSYAEDGAVSDVLNAGYYRDVIGLAGGTVELRAASGDGDAVKLTTLGDGLGVRSYGAADDVTTSAERRTLDDAETISLTLAETADLGDAMYIGFDFAKTRGTGDLLLDFYDDGALVEQASLAVLSPSAAHTLAAGVDFDAVVIGVSGGLGVDIAEITMVREELFGA